MKRTHSFDDYKSKTLYFYENLNLIKSISTSKSGYGSRTYFYTDSVLTKEVLSRPEGTIVYEYDYEHF